jgi:hypothetical protein
MLTKRDDPLLASWQYGLGKAVAFTSDAKNRWAAHWVDWPGYAKLWAQIVRWTVRSTARTPLETTVEITRRQGRITIDAVDDRGEFMNFLELKGNVVTPERTLKLSMQQTAPGRYEGTFDAPDIGQYIVSVGYRDARGRQRLHTAGTAVPYSPEYRELKANDATLTRLGETTEGLIYPALGTRGGRDPAQEVFRHDRRARTAPQEVWPLLLLLAALLFPADVAVRRLMIEPAEALAFARQGWERISGRLRARRRRRTAAREEAFDRLLTRKDRISARLATGAPEADAAVTGAGVGRAAPGAGTTVSERGARRDAAAVEGTSPVEREGRESAAATTEAPGRAAPQVVWNRPVPGVTPSETAGSPGAAPSPAGGAAATAPAGATPGGAPEPASGDTHTRRLLGAKRRAAGSDPERPAGPGGEQGAGGEKPE